MVQQDDGKLSFINTKGQQIGGRYKYALCFIDGFAMVQREDGKWSFINTKGQQIGGWFDYIKNFNNGMARVGQQDGAQYYMDTDGNLYDYWTKQPISPQNESHTRLNDLITEVLHTSIRKHLLHN